MREEEGGGCGWGGKYGATLARWASSSTQSWFYRFESDYVAFGDENKLVADTEAS